MADNTKRRIAVRSDTLTNWLAINPVLATNELIFVTDPTIANFKVGDGVSAFTLLPYIGSALAAYDPDNVPTPLFNQVLAGTFNQYGEMTSSVPSGSLPKMRRSHQGYTFAYGICTSGKFTWIRARNEGSTGGSGVSVLDETNLVHKTDVETIAGEKTFTDKLQVNAPIAAAGIIESTKDGIKFPDGTIQITADKNEERFDPDNVSTLLLEQVLAGTFNQYGEMTSSIPLGSLPKMRRSHQGYSFTFGIGTDGTYTWLKSNTQGAVLSADLILQTQVNTNTNGLALKANIASPTFTGIPAADTAAAGTSTTQLATTAFVTAADTVLQTQVTTNSSAIALKADITYVDSSIAAEVIARQNADNRLQNNINLKANIDSPALTGIPTTPTPSAGISTNQITNTQWVKQEIASSITSSIRAAGNWDASTNLYPSATSGTGAGGSIRIGDLFIISVAGTLGGIPVDYGDEVYAISLAPGQVATNWAILEHNVMQATEGLRGTLFIANSVEASVEAPVEDTKVVTLKKLWLAFAQYVSQPRTIAGKWTFKSGVDLSNQKLQNVSSGTVATDGVNFGQLTNAQSYGFIGARNEHILRNNDFYSANLDDSIRLVGGGYVTLNLNGSLGSGVAGTTQLFGVRVPKDDLAMTISGQEVKVTFDGKSSLQLQPGEWRIFGLDLSTIGFAYKTMFFGVITPVYTGTGTATDGAMTQAATTTALALKANIASPTLTGIPSAPTAAAGTSTTQLATTAFVTAADTILQGQITTNTSAIASISNSTIIAYADALAINTNKGTTKFKKGVFYRITNRVLQGTGTTGDVVVAAVSDYELATSGQFYVGVPDYESGMVWTKSRTGYSPTTYAADVIHLGKTWTLKTGGVPTDEPITGSASWAIKINATAAGVLPDVNGNFIFEWDEILYTLSSDWINERKDKRGNVISMSIAGGNDYRVSSPETIDQFAWGHISIFGNHISDSLLSDVFLRGTVSPYISNNIINESEFRGPVGSLNQSDTTSINGLDIELCTINYALISNTTANYFQSLIVNSGSLRNNNFITCRDSIITGGSINGLGVPAFPCDFSGNITTDATISSTIAPTISTQFIGIIAIGTINMGLNENHTNEIIGYTDAAVTVLSAAQTANLTAEIAARINGDTILQTQINTLGRSKLWQVGGGAGNPGYKSGQLLYNSIGKDFYYLADITGANAQAEPLLLTSTAVTNALVHWMNGQPVWRYIGDPNDNNISLGDPALLGQLGANIINNTYGIFVKNNVYGDGSNGNIYGDYCQQNTFGGGSGYNTYGVNNRNNTYGTGHGHNRFASFIQSCVFGNNLSFCHFESDAVYLQVGDNCSHVDVYNCNGTSTTPFVIPAGTTNAVYRNNALVVPYTLLQASSTVLGGIKLGAGLTYNTTTAQVDGLPLYAALGVNTDGPINQAVISNVLIPIQKALKVGTNVGNGSQAPVSVGGYLANVTGLESASVGGGAINISGSDSGTVGGSQVNIYGSNSGAVGAAFSAITGDNSFLGGGYGNTIRSLNAACIGSGGMTLPLGANYSVVVGGNGFAAPALPETQFTPQIYLFKMGGGVSLLSPDGNTRSIITISNTGQALLNGTAFGGSTSPTYTLPQSSSNVLGGLKLGAGLTYNTTTGQVDANVAAPLYSAPGTNADSAMTQAATTTALALKANIASPTFTGIPAADTAAAGTSTTQLATTAFVTAADTNLQTQITTNASAIALKANIASPTFTGIPAADTAVDGTSTTQLATTAFVTAADTNLQTQITTNTSAITTNATAIANNASAIALKANIASPRFTGIPAAPTAAPGTATTQLANTAFVAAFVAASKTAISLTYTQLIAATTGAGTLVPSQWYLLTDYNTTHTIVNTTVTNVGPIEPLLLQAASPNTLAQQGFSTVYVRDTIFYTSDNTDLRLAGATKGFIYRRIDNQWANDIPMDFRAIKFRRWEAVAGGGSYTATTNNNGLFRDAYLFNPTAYNNGKSYGNSWTGITTTGNICNILNTVADATSTVIGNVLSSNSTFNNNTLINSFVSGNVLSTNSNFDNNTLINSNIGSNTLINSGITGNNLTSSLFSFNILTSGSIISSNTMGSGYIQYNNLSGSSNIQGNTTVGGGYITYNTLTVSSVITNNTLNGSARMDYNTVSGSGAIYYNIINVGGSITANTVNSASLNYNTTAGKIVANTFAGGVMNSNNLVLGSQIISNNLAITSSINSNNLSDSTSIISTNTLVNSSSITNITISSNSIKSNFFNKSSCSAVSPAAGVAFTGNTLINTLNPPTSLANKLYNNEYEVITSATIPATILYLIPGTANDGAMTQAATTTALALKANIASPTFTGIPAADTAVAGTSTTQLATTSFVTAADTNLQGQITNNTSAIALKANIASPTFTGIPAADTAVAGTSTTQLATTAFVTAADTNLQGQITNNTNTLALKANIASPTFTGIPAADTAAAGTSTTQLATTSFVTAADTNLQGQITANTNTLALKANIASPTLTGIPAAPTAAVGTSTTQIATTAFVTASAYTLPQASSTVLGGIKLGAGLTYNATTGKVDGFTTSGELLRLTSRAYYFSSQTNLLLGYSTLQAALTDNYNEIINNYGTGQPSNLPIFLTRAVGSMAVTSSLNLSFQLFGDTPDPANVFVDFGIKLKVSNVNRVSYSGYTNGDGTLVATTYPSSAPQSVYLSNGQCLINFDFAIGTPYAASNLYLDNYSIVKWANTSGAPITVYLKGASVIPAAPYPTGITVVDQRNVKFNQIGTGLIISPITGNLTVTTDATKANIASPTFTGIPSADTAAPGTSTTQLATTAFVTAADTNLQGQITNNTSAIALKANIASPTFTGIPAADTAAAGTSTTQLATTAFVTAADTNLQGQITNNTNTLALKANIASPTFTGIPLAPTASAGTSTTQLATTAFVTAADTNLQGQITNNTSAIALKANIASPTFTGIPAADTAAAGTSTTQLATTAFVGAANATTQTQVTNNTNALALKANIASPTFTGIPAADTAAAGTSTTQLATTAFVTAADTNLQGQITNNTNTLALKANIASPTFTGIPLAPTAVAGTSTTQLATTGFVTAADTNLQTQITNNTNALALKANIASPTFTGIPAADTAAAGTSTTQLATTSFVTAADTNLQGQITANTNTLALKANIASPTFTGIPLAPTAAAGTSTTQLATTAFVTASAYTLLQASSTVLGGIKLGAGLTYNSTTGQVDAPPTDTFAILSYGASISLDFSAANVQTLSATGNISFAASANVALLKTKELYITNTSTTAPITLTFPAGWVFFPGPAPTTLAAGKQAVLTLRSVGTSDSLIKAAYVAQS